ncbi:conserved hypothetical protein [Candida dubliniensis CD36]|uniref:Uncharacterized protein n=1 Tax=Candida dubliniensis (strain CD36 / ATCC MYA-646 / CBS 7987 / NCPF 3949 / NRRL Y-17841) TaxID=573826 RepID=B9WFY8_CANDC|nr:conserved hypothetical protein [Candida dubliniensis CD36]CAX42157.1 conserved hypothetical protein [Candida dubliniensis CD36]
MIQKFTCVPATDYDVIVVSNGTKSQIQSKVAVAKPARITYLHDLPSLSSYLSEVPNFTGKIIFMFFDGVQYIQDFICDAIDLYGKTPFSLVQNAYFYFDKLENDPVNLDLQFNTVAVIVNDVLKKSNFMLDRVRGVYIDDLSLVGDRSFSMKRLICNFPNVEKFVLQSNAKITF